MNQKYLQGKHPEKPSRQGPFEEDMKSLHLPSQVKGIQKNFPHRLFFHKAKQIEQPLLHH